MSKPQPIFVRVAHAKEAFGLHPSTIYRLAQRGEVTIYKRGGASFLRTSEMITYILGAPSAA